jgi:hypothetical protein
MYSLFYCTEQKIRISLITRSKCFLYCFYLRRAATPRTGYSRVSIAGSQSTQNEESCLIFEFFHLIFSVHLKRVNRVVVGTGGGGGGGGGGGVTGGKNLNFSKN